MYHWDGGKRASGGLVQALSLKEVHEEEDEMDDAAEEAEELQAERIREAEQLSRSHLDFASAPDSMLPSSCSNACC